MAVTTRKRPNQEPALAGTRNARLFSEGYRYLDYEKTSKLRPDITIDDSKLLIVPEGSTVANLEDMRARKLNDWRNEKDPQILWEKSWKFKTFEIEIKELKSFNRRFNAINLLLISFPVPRKYNFSAMIDLKLEQCANYLEKLNQNKNMKFLLQ